MDYHHDTSLKSILEDDSISLASKTHICFYSNKGARLWLVVRPSIHLFCITHFTFTSALCFRLDLIQLSASILFTCECEHGLDAFGTQLARCPFGGQWITTHGTIQDVMYAFVQESGHTYGENNGMPLHQESHYESIYT
jgi:hypothetical protein